MFYVGQKVVCVNAEWGVFNLPGKRYLESKWVLEGGVVYTIRELLTDNLGRATMKLVELIDRSEFDVGYNRERFRPAVEKKTDISLFKAMLNKTPQQNKKELLNS